MKTSALKIFALLAAFGGPALAQSTQPAADNSAEQLLRQMFRPGGSVAPVDPIVFPPDQPEGVPATRPVDRLTIIREGTYLVNRTATLRRGSGGLTCEIDPTEVAPGLPASSVLPGRQRTAVERMLENKDTLRLVITARITEFHDANYVEISRAAEMDDLASTAAQTTAAPPAPSPTTKPLAKDASANELLEQMLGASSNAKKIIPSVEGGGTDKTGGAAAVVPGAEVNAIQREGSYVVDRIGRLTRGVDGQTWEFTFDADGKALKDTPVIILPNLKLMAMETAVGSSNRDLRFRITGMITEYKQRNYVLLDKVVVVPDVSQAF